MSLRPRQIRIYQDSCDILRPSRAPNGDMTYTVVASGVGCKLFTTPNNDEAVGISQSRASHVFDLNKLHFDLGTDVRAEDIVKVTSYDPQPNSYYRVTGMPYPRKGVANRTEVYLTPSGKPVSS